MFYTNKINYNIKVWTPHILALVSMEVLAEEIEDPFGVDDNDLPTDEIAEKIKGNCKEIFKIN